MAIKKKLNEATKITERREKKMLNELKTAYTDAYKEMKKQMQDALNQFGEDAKFVQENMVKYQRLDKLTKNIESELKKAESIQDFQMKTYLKDAYELNYYYTGYTMETESLVKLNYSILDRKQVAAAVSNDLMKIAIDDNKRATRNKIRRALTQSVASGEGIQKSAKRIKDATNYGLNRSVKIARTETTRIMGEARNSGFEHAKTRGIEVKKKWLATKDGRTRDSHGSIDGEIVNLNNTFSNGLMYPGDPAGDAAEVINCRCTHVADIPDIDYSKFNISESEELGEYQTFEEWQRDRL